MVNQVNDQTPPTRLNSPQDRGSSDRSNCHADINSSCTQVYNDAQNTEFYKDTSKLLVINTKTHAVPSNCNFGNNFRTHILKNFLYTKESHSGTSHVLRIAVSSIAVSHLGKSHYCDYASAHSFSLHTDTEKHSVTACALDMSLRYFGIAIFTQNICLSHNIYNIVDLCQTMRKAISYVFCFKLFMFLSSNTDCHSLVAE